MAFDLSERFHVFSCENSREILFHKNYIDILLDYSSVAFELHFVDFEPEVGRKSSSKDDIGQRVKAW